MRFRNPKSTFLWCLAASQLFAVTSVTAQADYAFTNGNGKRTVSNTVYNDHRDQRFAEKQTLMTVLTELNRTRGVFFLFSDQQLAEKMVNPVADHNQAVEK